MNEKAPVGQRLKTVFVEQTAPFTEADVIRISCEIDNLKEKLGLASVKV